MGNSMSMKTAIPISRSRLAAGFLLACIVFLGCRGTALTPAAHTVALRTPIPTETATRTPVPTATPLPTLSPTPLPEATFKEPCISYYDLTNGDLKFTCFRSGNWYTSSVDTEGDIGLYPSLAFDRFSNPHISYYSRSDESLKLASYDGKEWATETVPADGNAGLFTSLAIRWDGTVFISYYRQDDGSIYVATRSGEQWSTEKVDIAGTSNDRIFLEQYETSLALDRNGSPVVSYIQTETQGLMFARLDPEGAWSTEPIPGTSPAGWSHSMALDADGSPVISFFDSNREALKLATWDGDQWKITVFDDDGNVGTFSSLHFDKSGALQVAYLNDDVDDIRFRSEARTIDIPTRSQIGWYLSMALDDDGNPWIAFYERRQHDLGLARFDNGRFRITYISSSGDTGWFPCLKFVPVYEGD